VCLQEIEPRCGEALCKLFPSDDNVDLNDIVREAKRSNARRGDFNFRSNRGRDSFRGRGDFRLELFICGLIQVLCEKVLRAMCKKDIEISLEKSSFSKVLYVVSYKTYNSL